MCVHTSYIYIYETNGGGSLHDVPQFDETLALMQDPMSNQRPKLEQHLLLGS